MSPPPGPDYSNELGSHVFLPWVRRGVGVHVGRVDGDAAAAPRATLDVGVSIGPGPLSTAAPIDISLALFGPGDITSLDGRVVVRSWPKPNVFEAEPNYFPLLDIDPADLPWRYTPARASAKDRLRPWLVLVALRDDEIESYAPPSGKQKTGVLSVKSSDALPPLAQSWAWAHVQVTGQTTADPGVVLDLLNNEPHNVVARLLCPRRLDERTAYTAFLVPALERARLAGLGQKPADGIDGLAPAWVAAQQHVQLPVYYQWRFQTGLTGDFESLVRRVKPRPMPKTVGSRPTDVGDPGLALPAAASIPLAVEAALRALDSESTTWSDADVAAWTPPLENLLNRPTQLLAAPGHERVVAPPLYGRWYAATDTLNSAAHPGWWFTDVNRDPRLRVHAGVGTLVVQSEQQQLLAGAWAQVATIRAANEALRLAQLAREQAQRLYERHLVTRTDESLLIFTTPLHGRVRTSPTTVAAATRSSPLSIGLLHGAWRRLTRPRGPLGARLAAVRLPNAASLLSRVNSARLRPAAPPATPSNLVTPSRAGSGLAPSWLTPELLAWLISLSKLDLLRTLLMLLIAAVLFVLGGGALAIAIAVVTLAIRFFGASLFSSAPIEELAIKVALRSGTLTASQIMEAPPRPAFVPKEYSRVETPSAAPPPLPAGASESASATRFRNAAAEAFTALRAPVAPGQVLRTANVPTLRSRLAAALDPRLTVAESYRQRITIAPHLRWNPPDVLEPVMLAPSFDQPMYEPLYAISADWILPGLDQVPPDTVSLVRTNEGFIESFMLGANVEMARTLLFNEYPTDQRGTYFRQFWDSSGYVDPTGAAVDPDTLRDIRPIDNWQNSSLGSNSSRVAPPGGDFLVLLLRAELLRRYPNTVVYATRAKWNTDGVRDLDDTTESQPVFHGTLGEGVGFWGFNLTVAQVRGGDKPTDDPGWFFILQEPPTEPRCGLEPAGAFGGAQPNDWRNLSWSDLAATSDALPAITYIDLDAALPDTTQVVDSKHAAWHGDAGTGATGARASDLAYITYRVPVRIAVHGSTMIPPELLQP